MKSKFQLLVYFCFLTVLLLIAFIFSISSGSVSIPIDEVLNIIFGGTSTHKTWSTIILEYRLPKSIMALCAGASLSIAGLFLQTLFRNPLAGPYVLGITSGASLGVSLLILATESLQLVFNPEQLRGEFSLILAASLGAGLTTSLALLFSLRMQGTLGLLLLGIMFSYFANAITGLLLFFSSADKMQSFLFWNYGTFNQITWSKLEVFIPIMLFSLFCASFLTKPLNAFLLGENYSRAIGFSVGRLRFFIVISASILGASVTAFCGPIAFIGLAVPHLCRFIFRMADHRILFLASILLGGFFALLSDIISQLPGMELTLPLNIITAILGAPMLIAILLKNKLN